MSTFLAFHSYPISLQHLWFSVLNDLLNSISLNVTVETLSLNIYVLVDKKADVFKHQLFCGILLTPKMLSLLLVFQLFRGYFTTPRVFTFFSRVSLFTPRVFTFFSRVFHSTLRVFTFFSRVFHSTPRVFAFFSRVSLFTPRVFTFFSRVFHSTPRVFHSLLHISFL